MPLPLPLLFARYELHVVPQHQGSGIGRQLMQHLEAIAKLKHMPKIMLTVQIANVNAMHFYRKLGYTLKRSSLFSCFSHVSPLAFPWIQFVPQIMPPPPLAATRSYQKPLTLKIIKIKGFYN